MLSLFPNILCPHLVTLFVILYPLLQFPETGRFHDMAYCRKEKEEDDILDIQLQIEGACTPVNIDACAGVVVTKAGNRGQKGEERAKKKRER